MACHGCATKFGFFEKEVGCPDCDFVYCKKCLKYEVKNPEKGVARKVCVKCHINLAEMEFPPDNMDEYAKKFRRCIETMCETDGNAKYNFKDQKDRFGSVREAFDYESQKLAERLQVLDTEYKKTWPRLKTEEELSERLNKIQDKPSTSKDSTTAYKVPDRCTAVEQADQLLQQYMEEEALNNQLPKPELELEARLARLRGEGSAKIPCSSTKQVTKGISETKCSNPNKNVEEEGSPLSSKRNFKGVWGLDIPENDNSDEEEEATAQSIAKKAILDAQLKAELEKLSLEEEELTELDEKREYPWCIICNENASKRCLECDGDLYCDACFMECCKPEDHLSEPFIKAEK